MEVSFEFANGGADHVEINPFALLDKTCEQAFVTHGIDQAWDALAVIVNPPERRTCEVGSAVTAGDMDAMLDILPHFRTLERAQMVADSDALTKLSEAMIIQPLAQLGLAHEHNLEELAVIGFEIGKQSNLFKEIEGEILGFVDDQHGFAALFDLFEEKFVDGRDGFEPVQTFDIQAKFHRNGLHELVCVQDRVQDERGRVFVAKLFQHRPAERRLAGADFPRELDETFPLANAVEQMIQRLAMLGTEVQEARVRRNVERRLRQAIVFQIHASDLAKSVPPVALAHALAPPLPRQK